MARTAINFGKALETLGLPERIVALLLLIGGPSVMYFGPYEVYVGWQFKLLMATFMAACCMALAYFYVRYRDWVNNDCEGSLLFVDPVVLRDISTDATGATFVSALQMAVKMATRHERTLSYRVSAAEIYVGGAVGTSGASTNLVEIQSTHPVTTNGAAVKGLTVRGPTTGKFRVELLYGYPGRERFLFQRAMWFSLTFDTQGNLTAQKFSWIPYGEYENWKV